MKPSFVSLLSLGLALSSLVSTSKADEISSQSVDTWVKRFSQPQTAVTKLATQRVSGYLFGNEVDRNRSAIRTITKSLNGPTSPEEYFNDLGTRPEADGVRAVGLNFQSYWNEEMRIGLDLQFQFNSAELVGGYEGNRRKLKTLAEILRKTPSRNYSVMGHSCHIGNDTASGKRANFRLSSKRANRIRDLLLAMQVKPSQIVAMGCGHKFPKYPRTHAKKNRRVEVVLQKTERLP